MTRISVLNLRIKFGLLCIKHWKFQLMLLNLNLSLACLTFVRRFYVVPIILTDHLFSCASTKHRYEPSLSNLLFLRNFTFSFSTTHYFSRSWIIMFQRWKSDFANHVNCLSVFYLSKQMLKFFVCIIKCDLFN